MPAPEPAAPQDGDGEAGDVYGLLRVSGVEVALPLSVLREVVPCPAELAPLTVRAEGLLGAMELRRLVVPVVDLRLQPDAPADRGSQVVVVVAWDGHVLGVLADEVVGISRVATAALLPVRAGGGSALLAGATFRHPERGGVVSVLDPAALFALPGVPAVHDVSEVRSTAAGPAQVSTRTLTLVRCGAQVLGIDVAHVHTTLAHAAAQPSVLTGGSCLGVVEHTGLEVAVVDPLAVLGLGALVETEVAGGLVLDVGTGFVVLAVSTLLDLRTVAADEVLPLPGVAIRRGGLYEGLADLPGLGQCLVLDGAALRADGELRTLGGLNTALDPLAGGGDGAAGEAAGDAGRTGVPHLLYRAGTDLVSPVAQVAEILPVPAAMTATGADPALLGVVVHRRAAVPVLDLAALLGRPAPAPGPGGCLLLVQGPGAPVAFAVEALRSIVEPSWVDPAPRPRPGPRSPLEVVAASPLVGVGEGTAQLLPAVDLLALARLVLQGADAEETGTDPGAAQPAEELLPSAG